MVLNRFKHPPGGVFGTKLKKSEKFFLQIVSKTVKKHAIFEKMEKIHKKWMILQEMDVILMILMHKNL